MHALQSCDFCSEEADGTFEIVPPSLEPTEAEQRRVLLCRECAARLEDVLEPLLSRLGVENDVSDPGGTIDAEQASAAGDQDDPGGITDDLELYEPTTPGITDSSSGSTRDDADGDTSTGDAGGEGFTQRVTDAVTKNAITLGMTSDSSATNERTSHEAVSDDSTESDQRDTATTVGQPEASTESDQPEASTESGQPGDSRTAEQSDDAVYGISVPSESAPRHYTKVVRFLRNREFPMTRTTVETLVAGAYDLEDDEVEAILEFALEQEEFLEDDYQLRRP